MESHALEVLQQGIWASITGGWFYDFRQNIFCNTFHLYLWLFLLCFPFILHLYCSPSILVCSFYCGAVGLLFAIIKLLNFRLHKIFDTSELFPEPTPRGKKFENQRKLPQLLGTKTTTEDEGIELQVLNGKRMGDRAHNVSLYDQTDDDSIISLELEAASSTIDLKVDVHRKNSSESSGELSPTMVKEIRPCGMKEVGDGLLRESRIETEDLPHSNMWLEHDQSNNNSNINNNNKTRLKTEEIRGIQDNDFIFSQSDCHIAKFRKESMEKLSDEYKMSQSDCHISNLRQRATEQLEMKNCAGLTSGIPKQFNNRSESAKKNRQKSFFKNLNSDFQVDRNLNSVEKNKNFERGNLVSNGSCSILTSNETNGLEEMKNTGSLELPLRDKESIGSPSEKGLLYWKQHNLDKVKVEQVKLSPNRNLSENSKFCPESDDHSSDLNNATNRAEVLDSSESRVLAGQQETPVHCFNEEDSAVMDHSKEKSFLEILEENFDWYGSEYQDENSERSLRMKNKLKDISKSENGENVKDGCIEKNKPKSGLKFKIDSDEDSSDNCGSRSPLLCRHESLEKGSRSKIAHSSEDNLVKKSPITYTGQEEHPRCFSKIGRALSVDENVVLSKKLSKSKDLSTAKKNYFSSFMLPVNGSGDKLMTKDINGSENGKEVKKRGEDFPKRVGKPIRSRESLSPSTKKTSLPGSINLDDVDDIETQNTFKGEKEKHKDILSLSSERVGLDWLFENEERAQDEDESVRGSSEMSHSFPEKEIKDLKNQGPIPRTRVKYPEEESGKSVQRRSVVKKTDVLCNACPDSFDVEDESAKKKLDVERENEIIDEEDLSDSNDDETFSQIEGSTFLKETDESLNNSTTELSSLLPLSSLLSALNQPSSPFLAAFLASRRQISAGTPPSGTAETMPLQRTDETKEQEDLNITYKRNRRRRCPRYSIRRAQRMSRSARVSSLPLAALASVVSTNSGTHIATSHDDTSQGAVHCFQDEKGTWMSYTFDSLGGGTNHMPVPLPETHRVVNDEEYYQGDYYPHVDLPTSIFAEDIHPHELGGVSYGSSSKENDGPYRCSTFLQPLLRPPLSDKRDGDANYSTEAVYRLNSNSERRGFDQSQNSDFQHRGNLSIENESFTFPNVDVNMFRSTFASFLRDRLLFNERTLLGTINDSDPNSDYNSNVLGVTEFRNNNNNESDNNNNNSDDTGINDNNNNIDDGTVSNANHNNGRGVRRDANPGNRDNFYFDGVTSNVVPLRSPYSIITRQRSHSLHTPVGPQDVRLFSWGGNIEHGIEQENERNHFRIGKINWEEELMNLKRGYYYKFHYTPWNFVKIRFDRLYLMALLDRNLTFFECLLSVFLSLAVSVCGIFLLNCGFYHDYYAFMFCFVLAGCQYSLLKSVQPDATSPTHGYNRVVIYSRSIYFCLISLIILLLTENLDEISNHSFQIYRMQIINSYLLHVIRDSLVTMLLFFPIFFTLGLFPQINTFCLYSLEQIDVHVFGGNAMSTLVGALYCVFRSIVSVALIYGFAYGALSETKSSQHILYSIFSGLLISLSYHLSRSSSNPNILWEIVKNHLFQDELRNKNRPEKSNGSKINKSEVGKSSSGSLKSESGGKGGSGKNTANVELGPSNANESSEEIMKSVDYQTRSILSETFSESGNCFKGGSKKKENDEFVDPLPQQLKDTVNARLQNDAIVCSFVAILVFGIHCSTVFTALQPDLNPILWGIAGCSGVILHYIVPELRKHLPWLCLASPVLRSREHGQFEVKKAAKVMWFEETYVILCFLERNVLYPVLVLASLTYDGPRICSKFGVPLGAFITCICGLKVMRSAFSNTCQQYIIVIFTALLFEFDYYACSETFLVDYFFMGIIFSKTYEFILKIRFVVIYIAPWQITWGSAFHAFAQPFSVPHSAMLFVQAALSSLLSAPLNPFLGSAIFLASYVRPIKFWERDYNTKRVDHSNTRLSSHLERNLGCDDNNLNSIFYEHLTRSLQSTLCGDLELGRWGPVFQGDCFVLASDYLNCLIHIVEMGNGLVTFQMRGLEFRGTYCQQREVEAISERVEEDDGCCCCEPGHLPHLLSINAAFSKRWLAWEVAATKYVLEGYSISDNSAASTLQIFDFRKILVTYYIKSIIFYCIRSPKLEEWLANPTISAALKPLSDLNFVDLDPVFNVNIDQDYDIRAEGITKNSFCSVYMEWIHYCCAKREKKIDDFLDSSIISLCFALSLMGRRTLGTASHNTVSSVEFFLYGLHALFKGDFRITSIRDDWVFADIEILMKVVAPGIRMSLKLHQDHFMSPEEYDDPEALYDAISTHEKDLVISHEGDPAWRTAVLSGTPSLLALRHVLDEGTDEYKVIMLNKRFLNFRVIKLNKECVRGLWAGQQQELVFLRNRNPERGSIQNAKQVLRNIINSSCDQPIGYPIYVSPLTTSYSDTNEQLTGIIGGPLSLQGLKNTAFKIWGRIKERFREGCSSGSAGNVDEGGHSLPNEGVYPMTNINIHSGYGHNTPGSQSMDSSQIQLGSCNRAGSLGRNSQGGRGSLPSFNKNSTTLASLAAELTKGECFLRERETSFTFIKERPNREDITKRQDERDRKKEERDMRKEKERIPGNDATDCETGKDKEAVYQRVRITDPNLVFDAINLGRRIDVLWPDEAMRSKGGRSYWKDWLPDTGMEGQVVHRWVPNHKEASKRSNVDKTILLVKIEDKYVPIAEAGVQDLGVEV